MKVLVIEDDSRVADFLHRGLRAEGYDVTAANNGTQGFELGQTGEFSIIILDLMLPGMHGLEVCQALRAHNCLTPILMLTAMDTTEDKIDGLKFGADDYMTKPFDIDELLARINALVRRATQFESKSQNLVVADLVFDTETLIVQRAGNTIELTAKEMALLELMMGAPGRVFSRERILNAVWGSSEDPLTNIIDVYIRRLRVKIDDHRGVPLIKTIRGRGYSLGTTQNRDHI